MFKRIAAFLLLLILILAVMAPAFAEDGSITYKREGNASDFVFEPGTKHAPNDLFTKFKDVMPGDELTERIELRNDGKKNAYIRVYMKADGKKSSSTSVDPVSKEGYQEMDGLLDHLELNVKYMGYQTNLYTPGVTTAASAHDWIYLGELEQGGKAFLDITLKVPVDLDTKYSNALGVLDWGFKIEEIENNGSPKTGDESNVLLYSIMAAGACAAAYVTYRRIRKAY